MSVADLDDLRRIPGIGDWRGEAGSKLARF
jgi:hypothetical protein